MKIIQYFIHQYGYTSRISIMGFVTGEKEFLAVGISREHEECHGSSEKHLKVSV